MFYFSGLVAQKWFKRLALKFQGTNFGTIKIVMEFLEDIFLNSVTSEK